jgi:CHAD domain-containing protein
VAKGQRIAGIAAHDPYASVAARTVAVRAHEVFAHGREVLALSDIEPLHDMRVATRRLRAALEIFAPCFPPKRFARTLTDVKRLADALGERRDRDVQIAWLESYAEGESGSGRAAVLALVDELRAEQRRANEALASALDAAEASGLAGRLEELSAAAAKRPRGSRGRSRTRARAPAADAARRRSGGRSPEIRRSGARSAGSAPTEAREATGPGR